MKPLSVRLLAELVEGSVQGDPERVITGIAELSTAGPRDLGFFYNAAYKQRALETKAGALLLMEPIATPAAQILVKDVRLAIAKIAQYFFPRPSAQAHQVSPRAAIAEDATLEEPVDVGHNAVVESRAKIGAGSVIMPSVFVGKDAAIGRDCVLYPNVTICNGVQIGQRVTIYPGTVIGGFGFGYAMEKDRWVAFPQMGTVIIEDDVEIGSNCAIDRGALGNTVIGRGTKIDNLVHMAHNCTVGHDSIIAAGSFFSGSVKIGNRVTIAGHVVSAGHLSIADDARVGGNTGLLHDLPEGKDYMGWPVMEKKRWFRTMRAVGELLELREEVQRLAAALGVPSRLHDETKTEGHA